MDVIYESSSLIQWREWDGKGRSILQHVCLCIRVVSSLKLNCTGYADRSKSHNVSITIIVLVLPNTVRLILVNNVCPRGCGSRGCNSVCIVTGCDNIVTIEKMMDFQLTSDKRGWRGMLKTHATYPGTR